MHKSRADLGRLRAQAAALVVVMSMLPTSAVWAADVFLNGVKVTGMANQEFKNAKVRLDASGNVYIEVEGISVQRQDVGPNGQVSTPTPALRQSYWLISDKTAPGMTQYDIDVHINGQFVVRVKSEDKAQLVMDITKFIVPGQNRVNFTAIKNLKDSRKSFSADHKLKLVLGTGQKNGAALMIDRQLATYERNASQVDNHGAEQMFTAQ